MSRKSKELRPAKLPPITCEPTAETIASCTHCGERNYGDPPRTQLFDVLIPHQSGYSAQKLFFCHACLGALAHAIFPWRGLSRPRSPRAKGRRGAPTSPVMQQQAARMRALAAEWRRLGGREGTGLTFFDWKAKRY